MSQASPRGRTPSEGDAASFQGSSLSSQLHTELLHLAYHRAILDRAIINGVAGDAGTGTRPPSHEEASAAATMGIKLDPASPEAAPEPAISRPLACPTEETYIPKHESRFPAATRAAVLCMRSALQSLYSSSECYTQVLELPGDDPPTANEQASWLSLVAPSPHTSWHRSA